MGQPNNRATDRLLSFDPSMAALAAFLIAFTGMMGRIARAANATCAASRSLRKLVAEGKQWRKLLTKPCKRKAVR